MKPEIEKTAGESFINELMKIAGVPERAGAWVGKALSSIKTSPRRFASSIRAGYKGKAPVQSPSRAPIFTPGRRNIYGGDPMLAESVKRTLKSMRSERPAFPSKKVKLKSLGKVTGVTRTLIK